MKNRFSKRLLALLLTVMLMLAAMPLQLNVSAATIGGLDSLTCAGFISNTTAQKYIDKMMKYYINNYSSLQTTLTGGKSVVFMFEGGSDNFTAGSSNYELVVGDTRNQAVCIVVQLNSSGNAYIPFYSENCSSVPDNPRNCTNGVAYSGSTTIKDGIYSFYTWNHQSQYAAFQINFQQGYYTPTANLNGYTAGASGLNIHTRSTNTCNGVSWSWSAGCQVIGSGAYTSNVFNQFMQTVAGISWNPWIDYYNKTFNTFASTGTTKGYYVIDRQLGKMNASGVKYGSGSLISLYNQTALDNITAFSTTASAAAPEDFEAVDYTTYYLPACDSSCVTMYATMNSMGIAGNSTNLKKIAYANGYTVDTYSGTAEQNTALLNLWKQGLLKNPDATCDPAYPIAAESATNLASAIGSFGFDNSANAISRIKIANKTTNETTLLNLMKKGTLLQPTGSATVIEAESSALINKTANFTTLSSGGASGASVLYTPNGGNFSLSFTGTKLDLITTMGPRLKSMHFSVDGGEFKRVEHGATTSSALNRVYSTGTLSNGTHTLVVKCEGQAHIDAFEVFGGTIVACDEPVEAMTVLEAADDTKVQINGNWEIVEERALDNGRAIYTPNNGEVYFSFYGSQFTINSYMQNQQGKLSISIDGATATEINLLTDESASSFRTQVFDSGVLKSGIHSVKIKAEGSAYIDSFDIYGEARNTFSCDECQTVLSDTSFVCEHDAKNVSDMISTYQDESADFSVVASSSLTGGDTGVESDTAYLYNPASGTARKNGFALYQPIKGDFYGNESEWTVDTWVYISDVTSYFMIMQFTPQSGLSYYSVADSTKFNNFTENWAYRMCFTSSETGAGKMALKQGWNHLQIPLSDFLLGTTGNTHNVAAYKHLSDMNGVLDAVTFHENSATNYGTYDFAVASVKLVKTHECEIIPEPEPEPEPELEFALNEVENITDSIILSNAWVRRFNKNLSNRYAYHTTTGGKMQFSFAGTQFEIISYKSPSQGEIYISIDGSEEFLAADLYSDVADTYFKQTVYTSDELENTIHTVTVRVDGKAYLDALNIKGDILFCTTPIHDDVTIEVENILDAVYTGNWTKKYAWKHSGHNAMYNTDGGSVTFDFEGDELSLISYKAASQGKLYVSIDGGDEVEVSLYDESSDTLYATNVYNTDLAYDTHTVTIRTSGKVYVDAIVINRESAETVTYEGENGEITLEGDWAQKYSWSHSNHNAMYTATGGTASFTYTGYDFKLLSYKAKTQGKMYVSIDGGETIEVDLYDDSSDTLFKTVVFDGAGMDYGTHTVEITTSGKVYFDAVKIDGTLN